MDAVMREAFCNKLAAEYKSYQAAILSLSNGEIYGRCYEIDTLVNFYEILLEKSETMSNNILALLLRQDNILLWLYDIWLKKDDSFYREMEEHITEELEKLTKQKAA